MMKALFLASLLTFFALVIPAQSQDTNFSNLGGFGINMPSNTSEKAEFKSESTNYAVDKEFVATLNIAFSGGWHSYYINPGTTGLPTEIALKAPDGFKIQGPYWGIPTRGGTAESGFYYGYSTAKFAWIITPEANAPAETTFTATSSWQLCGKDGCLPPSDPKDFTLALKKGEASAMTLPQGYAYPQSINPAYKDWDFSVSSQNNTSVTLKITPTGTTELNDIYFFSNNGFIAPDQDQPLVKEGNSYLITLPINDGKNSLYPTPEKSTSSLSGIFSFSINNHKEGILIDVPLTVSNAVASGNKAVTGIDQALNPETVVKEDMGLGGILFALFIGGFILNLMPCVFPVIGLKIMSFVEMGGGDRKKVLMHSLTFVFGVILSFWIITTLLVILKQSIPSINWAFWLENPWVILILLFLMLGLGLNMLGIFEIGASATSIGGSAQQKKGYAGSFYSGVLATVVATPCSAPFLGAAMGPAMNLSAPWMFVAFTCMGLGLSSPYLILGALPQLTKYLPRPGAWMESFKQGLSFLLFGTAVWLLWTYWAFFPEEASLASLTMLFGLVVFALACWIKGRWDLPYKSKRAQWIARILCILLLCSSVYLSKPYSAPEVDPFKENAEDSIALNWEPWSLKAQEEAMDEGRPVYVDFTARWCATCQVNKSVAYDTAVRKIISEHNILLLKADKTTSNPEIDAELKKLGKTSVPVNVLYIPGDKKPYITQVNLTSGYLEGFLKEHLKK